MVCIFQEALANVRKHAKANHVNVLIAKKDYQVKDGYYIYLQVEDDGIGFLAQDSKHSFGLKTMKEPAQLAQQELWLFTRHSARVP